jgi:hypothetical protein
MKKAIDIGFLEREGYGNSKEIVVYQKTAANNRARLAVSMLERWGAVAGTPDGEDSAGRAKLNHMPVDDMVKRACETAEKAFIEFERRGWLLDLPKPILQNDK